MIASRINIDEDKSSILVIVIEKDNLDRMKQGDPITLEAERHGGKVLRGIKYPECLSLIIAYEADDVELYKLARNGNTFELLQYLQRNRRWDPKSDGIVVELGKGQASHD